MKLYFIRHGLSEMNALGLRAGRSETPLTRKGRTQALVAGQEAKTLAIDTVATSPMGRTLETAKIIAKEISYPTSKIHVSNLLIERDFGPLEGTPWDPDLNIDDNLDIESVEEILNRANLALQWLQSLQAENILVVSHGAFGRALRSLLVADLPFSSPKQIPNAKIIRWL